MCIEPILRKFSKSSCQTLIFLIVNFGSLSLKVIYVRPNWQTNHTVWSRDISLLRCGCIQYELQGDCIEHIKGRVRFITPSSSPKLVSLVFVLLFDKDSLSIIWKRKKTFEIFQFCIAFEVYANAFDLQGNDNGKSSVKSYVVKLIFRIFHLSFPCISKIVADTSKTILNEECKIVLKC